MLYHFFPWYILIFLSDIWHLVLLIESFTQSRQNTAPLSHTPSSFVSFHLATDSHYSALPGLELIHPQNDFSLWFPCFSFLGSCDYRHMSSACWSLNLPTSALGSGEWATYSTVFTTGKTMRGRLSVWNWWFCADEHWFHLTIPSNSSSVWSASITEHNLM